MLYHRGDNDLDYLLFCVYICVRFVQNAGKGYGTCIYYNPLKFFFVFYSKVETYSICVIISQFNICLLTLFFIIFDQHFASHQSVLQRMELGKSSADISCPCLLISISITTTGIHCSEGLKNCLSG